MGESDLQAISGKRYKKSEIFYCGMKGKATSVNPFKSQIQKLLENGRVQDALNAYICAYSSDFPDSEVLEILIDGVVEKARDYLSKNVKLNVDYFWCAECCNIMLDPVTLKCGHTFSKKCILSGTKSDSFECKKCNNKYSLAYLSQLKNSVTVSALVEKFSIAQCSGSKETVLAAKQMHNPDATTETGFSINDPKHGLSFNMGSQSPVMLYSSPMNYLKEGDSLVSFGEYERAIRAYLICFTLDSSLVQAKDAASKLFHNMLLKYQHTLSLKESNTGTLSLNAVPLTQRKSLTGSDGSLSSAGSSDSFIAAEEESSFSDEEETKDWSGMHWIEYTERSRLHLVLDHFYSDIEKLADQKNVSERIDISCLDKRDLECPLCMRILWEPVTTPCGHTFCRICLNRSLDHQPTCPLCKTSLAIFLAERVQSTTEFLDLAIKALFPDDYAERKAIHIEEMEELSNAGKDPKHVIPLFVCTIAYPTVPCPLHVFEPRYRLMIRQCMESGSRQFGMCAYIDDNIAEYGTMLEIRDVQYFPDGRSVVDTVGSRRFRILRKGERDGYHTGAVEFLKDEPLVGVDLQDIKDTHDRVYKISQAWFLRLPSDTKYQILQHFGPMPSVENNYLSSPNGPSWFWWMLAVLPLDPKSQLMILSMTSLPRRLNTLYRILRHLQSTTVT